MAKALPLLNQSEITSTFFLDATQEVLGKSVLLTELWPVPSILGAYVGLILIDFHFLKKRKPLDLKFLMMMYNLYQIAYNFYMVQQCLLPEAISYYYKHGCHPMEPSENSLLHRGLNMGFIFFVSKLTDLLDTVFIVLRKKHNQLSFLHLYHHIGMVGFTWIVLRNYIGEQLIIIVLANSFVHVVMYTYYALALLGPSVQKYLWWKKHVTLLQLGQFMFFTMYYGILLFFRCQQPTGISFFVLTQAVIFFKLFKDFYDKHYKNYTPVSQEAESSKKKQL